MASGPLRELTSRASFFLSAAVDFAKELGLELRTEAHEAARTGFGVPRTISSAASLGCFAVAAAGTASITLDLVKKVYGLKECEGCSGWEALMCRACSGTGHGKGAQEGGGGGQCAACTGTGIQKCPTCNGSAWKPKLTADRILDSPVAGWEAYRHCQPLEGDDEQRAIRAILGQGLAGVQPPTRPKDWQGSALASKVHQQFGLARDAGAGRTGELASTDGDEGKALNAVEERVLDAAWGEEWREEQVNKIIKKTNQDLAKLRKQSKQKAATVLPASVSTDAPPQAAETSKPASLSET